MLLHTIVLLFCYKNNSVDYHWDACYFAIYAILLFRGLPGTGTLAILLFCYSVVYHCSLHEGVTFSIHFLICIGNTLFTLVARRMRLGLAHCASANVCAFMIIYCAHVV